MPAYEAASGDVLAMVETYCRHLASPAGFSASTKPTLAEVQRFLDQSYFKIAAALVHAGFAVVQTDTEVVGFLQNLQAVETVIAVELTKPITGQGEPNERFLAFIAERDQLYDLLKSGMLAGMGGIAVSGSAGFVALTGASISTKDGIYTDSDFVGPRFRRGQFRAPGADPGTTRLSAETLG